MNEYYGATGTDFTYKVDFDELEALTDFYKTLRDNIEDDTAKFLKMFSNIDAIMTSCMEGRFGDNVRTMNETVHNLLSEQLESYIRSVSHNIVSNGKFLDNIEESDHFKGE